MTSIWAQNRNAYCSTALSSAATWVGNPLRSDCLAVIESTPLAGRVIIFFRFIFQYKPRRKLYQVGSNPLPIIFPETCVYNAHDDVVLKPS